MHPALAAKDSTLDESRTAQTTPVLNQTSPESEVASPIQQATSGDRSDSHPPVSQKAESMNQVRVPALAGLADLTMPPEGGTPTGMSNDEVALRRFQIRRLNTRH
jgi:hypothetical protein